MRYPSPLRYPGGKAALADFLTDTIDLNDLRDCAYYEPYAGGAGAALMLLTQGVVSEVYLNDADIRIYAFWRAALHSTEKFVKKISKVPLTIKEWKKQNEICAHPWRHRIFDIGFAAFYMNRCNRSGVLTGSGPIGGYEQEGKWRGGAKGTFCFLEKQNVPFVSLANPVTLVVRWQKQPLPEVCGRNRSGSHKCWQCLRLGFPGLAAEDCKKETSFGRMDVC